MDGKTNGLTIECVSSGRGSKATLTVRLADDVIACEMIDLAKPKARDHFAAAICESRPGIDRNDLMAKLLRLAADVTLPSGGAEPAIDLLDELDSGQIVRPDRIIIPEVCGLSVPTMTTRDGKPVGRLLTYLRWPDGKRERRVLGEFLDMPDGQRKWIHPRPSEPTPTASPRWSRSSRDAWLEGRLAPNPADLFQRLAKQIAYFVDLHPEHGPGIVATMTTWIIMTYAYLAWDAVPYLYVGGPLGSGKSRMFEILSRLVYRPFSSSSITAAAMFRTLDAEGGTLILDEAERLKQTQSPEVQEVLSMLLAGYKRGGRATRLEPAGDTFKTMAFDVYGPKAIACIAGLPPALSSRAIMVNMFRSAPGSDTPRRRIDADPTEWQRLRDDLHVLALEHGPTWLELAQRSDVCPTMSGRDYELWQPLLAIAWWLESHGAQGLHGLLAEHAAHSICGGRDDQTPDTDETLLRALADAVGNGERPSPQDILRRVQDSEHDEFNRWKPKGVSTVLSRYGLQTMKSHGRKIYANVTEADLARIERSYSVDLGIGSP